MGRIFMNQVGFTPDSSKKAVLDFGGSEFNIKDLNDKIVYEGKVSHFGTDEISGADVSVADFSDFKDKGNIF